MLSHRSCHMLGSAGDDACGHDDMHLAPVYQPPLSPNSVAQSSYSLSPVLLTLGRMLRRLATKSTSMIGLISSIVICNKASPRDLKGPMAASFANAVMSDPEKPVHLCQSCSNGAAPSFEAYHQSL